jgi:hypothetical protein
MIAADSVSRYDKATREEALITLKSEVDSTNRVLDSFDETFKKSGVRKVYLLEGNHERRILKWIVKHAMEWGDFENLGIKSMLRINERKYEFIPYRSQPLKIGKINIVHGYYVNQYHASKMLRNTGRNVFYGHTHDFQVHTLSHFEDDQPRMAMSCGCLCNFEQDYLDGRPTNWIHGITVINYDDDGFTPYFLPIVNYRCLYAGKQHKA